MMQQQIVTEEDRQVASEPAAAELSDIGSREGTIAAEARDVTAMGAALVERWRLRSLRLRTQLGLSVGASAAMACMLAVVVSRQSGSSVPVLALPLLAIFLGLPTLPFLAAWRSRREMNSEIELLAGQEDVHAIGALVDSLTVEDGRCRRLVIDALARLLPRLRPHDAELLNEAQRKALRQALALNLEFGLYKDWNTLTKPVNPEKPANRRALDFRVAIVQAFARIGGAEELAIVQRLARPGADTPARRILCDVAQEALPLLLARKEQQAGSAILLRPASAAAAASDELVRAAANICEVTPDQLLRSSQQEPDEP